MPQRPPQPSCGVLSAPSENTMHIHTHYDNLQLPQSATDAEIRQAYRRLSKRYHPDLNADPDAHRIMQLINRAYEVLSDPSSRAEHDRWIRAQYRRQYEVMPQPITYYYAEAAPAAKAPTRTPVKLMFALFGVSLLLAVLALWLGLGWLQQRNQAPVETAAPAPAQPIQIHIGVNSGTTAETVPATPPPLPATPADYIRADTAPNGTPWPGESGYIGGYPIVSGSGGSTIYADNVRNSSDVFAQLYEKHSPQPLRTFFLQERSELPLKNLDTGEYFIRYQQLDNGEFLDSESIAIGDNGQKATIYLQRGKAPAPKLHNDESP